MYEQITCLLLPRQHPVRLTHNAKHDFLSCKGTIHTPQAIGELPRLYLFSVKPL